MTVFHQFCVQQNLGGKLTSRDHGLTSLSKQLRTDGSVNYFYRGTFYSTPFYHLHMSQLQTNIHKTHPSATRQLYFPQAAFCSGSRNRGLKPGFETPSRSFGLAQRAGQPHCASRGRAVWAQPVPSVESPWRGFHPSHQGQGSGVKVSCLLHPASTAW